MSQPRQIQITSLPSNVQKLNITDQIKHTENYSIIAIEKTQGPVSQNQEVDIYLKPEPILMDTTDEIGASNSEIKSIKIDEEGSSEQIIEEKLENNYYNQQNK